MREDKEPEERRVKFVSFPFNGIDLGIPKIFREFFERRGVDPDVVNSFYNNTETVKVLKEEVDYTVRDTE